jgi:hypothetical protein
MKPETARFTSLPRTKNGRWAIRLLVLFALLLVLFALLFLINQTLFMPAPEPLPLPRLLLIVYGLLLILTGLACGAMGLISLIRERDRSWLVWLAVIPGAMILFFLLGEFLFPH